MQRRFVQLVLLAIALTVSGPLLPKAQADPPPACLTTSCYTFCANWSEYLIISCDPCTDSHTPPQMTETCYMECYDSREFLRASGYCSD